MDRRVIWAIGLMMIIALAPTFFLKAPAKPVAAVDSTQAATDTGSRVLGRDSAFGPVGVVEAPNGVPTPLAAPADTVVVSSPLYRYAISTRGGAIVRATMLKYDALDPADKGDPAQLLGSPLHQLALLVGSDTLSLATWDFAVSGGTGERTLAAGGGPETVSLSASRGRRGWT